MRKYGLLLFSQHPVHLSQFNLALKIQFALLPEILFIIPHIVLEILHTQFIIPQLEVDNGFVFKHTLKQIRIVLDLF